MDTRAALVNAIRKSEDKVFLNYTMLLKIPELTAH
jgi:hypothetical protein